MITEIFENLFKPVSDEEYDERRKNLYPLIKKFEDEIRDDKNDYSADSQGFIPFYQEYNDYYSEVSDDVDWFELFLYFKNDVELDDDGELALINGYLNWRKNDS